MGIITLIQPLYSELLTQNFLAFVDSKSFVRKCNALGITNEYTEAMNTSVDERNKDYFSAIFEEQKNSESFLADFLNKVYLGHQDQFADIIASLLIEDIKSAERLLSIDELLIDLETLGISSKKKEELIVAFSNYDSNYELKTKILLSLLIDQAIQGTAEQKPYNLLRAKLMASNILKPHLPHFVIEHNRLDEFRRFAQSLGGYKERRSYIHEKFQPLFELLMTNNQLNHIAKAIVIDNSYIRITWKKAMERMTNDPEGAITIARTLIETVCKHILDTFEKEYDDGADIAVLYKSTASALKLSPDQHTEQVFKQILSGCISVVNGLGSIRNKLSDAHGISETRAKPSTRHASLAVNLSGALCQFLMETFTQKQQ